MSTRAGADRRELIAGSAIRIIARDGVRALTHRAVDREAGLPEGSTSYHAKSRRALLELIVDDLATRAVADASAAAESLSAAFPGDHAPDIDELSAVITTLVETLAARHDDMRARYALILELDDVPALRDQLTTQSDVHSISRQVTADFLRRTGLSDTDARVEELIALADALVFQRTIMGMDAPVVPIVTAYLRGVSSGQGSLLSGE